MKMWERHPACIQPCYNLGLVQTYFILVSLFVTNISGSYQVQRNNLPETMMPSNFSSSSTPSSPPTTATFVMACYAPYYVFARDHCWLDDNTLVIADIDKVVKVTINMSTKNCTYSVYSDRPTMPLKIACSPDGKEIYVVNDDDYSVWVYDRNSLKAIWRPEGTLGSPYTVAMNSNIVIVGTWTKGPLYVYDRNRVYQGQISISQNQFRFYFTHLTEEGVFVATTFDDTLVIHDILQNSTTIAGETGSGDGQLDGPNDVTSVGDYILVCDRSNSRVPVFSQNGEFQSNLQFKGPEVHYSTTIAYRSGTKVLSLSSFQETLIRIYSLA